MNIPITVFSGGEASPKLIDRVDIEKYSSMCKILENFIPEKYGCATRRPGTLYIADLTEDAG
jgi:hypothetical protein